MIHDTKKWNKGLSLLAGLMQYPPASIDGDHVEQFHDIVKMLEEASDEDFSDFKIPAEKLAPHITSLRPGGYGGGRGSATYSKKRFCDTKYFFSRVNGLSNYIVSMHGKSPAIATPKDKIPAPTGPTHSTVINMSMDRSNLNILSPGASITQTSDFKTDDFRKLIESVKEFSSTQVLSQESREQINIDIGTVEVQIGSSRPSPSIIKECLASMKNTLENAAGGVLASGILFQLQRYLS
jgi:hypothetical protein